MRCPRGCSTSWTITCGSSPTSGRSSLIRTSRSTGSSPGTSVRSTQNGETGGCSATATAAPTCSSSPGRRSPGTSWSRAGRPRTTRPWLATGRPGDDAGDPRWTGPGSGSCRGSAGAARSAGSCCSTPTTSRDTPTNGNVGSQRPAGRSPTVCSPSTQDPGTRTSSPCSVSSTLTAGTARQAAPEVDQHFCSPQIVTRACLSRLPGKRARPVLRGPGRGNAPRLPDWKPVFYLLEAQELEPWLVNAKDVKHLPGRPKTDKLDAVWLCKVAERQMLRPSFVPPVQIRRLRDLTRYRVDLVNTRTAEKNRVEKLLEDAQIKLSAVVSDIFGVSGREMLAALIAGERDPKVLAQLARARMRAKISVLEEAFVGHFTDHHAFLLRTMLARIDETGADIAAVEAKIAELIAPFAQTVDRLDEIPGVGPTAAHVMIAEIGLDMSRFPTAAHLCSWARLAPGGKESAGKKKGRGSTGHGNPYLARDLGEAAVAAAKTDTFLGERYRRIARRRGKKKAIVAVGRSILVIVWQLLSDPRARFHDLGAEFYDNRTGPDRKKRNHIRQLEALGYKVTLEPAA